jgi:hypothetical protein
VFFEIIRYGKISLFEFLIIIFAISFDLFPTLNQVEVLKELEDILVSVDAIKVDIADIKIDIELLN